MNFDLKSVLDPNLHDALIELSKQDLVIQGVLNKATTEKELINALVAAIVCISDRELKNMEQVNSLLKSNPAIQKMLESKHDSTILHKDES